MNYFNLTKQAGFSLVETLVAISVLLIVMVGPMTVTSQTAKSATFATEQVQAFFLAQEGLEMAEKLRDDLILQYFAGTETDPWENFWHDSTGYYTFCHGANGCGLEWENELSLRTSPLINCNPITNCRLSYNSLGSIRSRFTHQTGAGIVQTPFTRIIKFNTDPLRPEAVEIVSTVTWRTGSLLAEQKVETRTYLYNIYDLP